MADMQTVVRGAFPRFLVSGAANTIVTYILYLVLIQFLPYRIGYSIAFATGVAIAYGLSRFYVFRKKAGWRSVTLFPFVYVFQYLAGLTVVSIWVEVLGWYAALAPIAATAVILPLTYLLTQRLFHWVPGKKGQ